MKSIHYNNEKAIARFRSSILWGHIVALASVGACNASSKTSAATQGVSFVEGHHPPLPTLQNTGGVILTAPKVKVITFNNDPLAPQLEAFAAQLGASTYWNATTSEYGVGLLSASAPVRDSYPWAQDNNSTTIAALLQARLGGASAPWGDPDPQTIYTVVMPPETTQVGDPNDGACNRAVGWHSAFHPTGSQAAIPFAVIARCGHSTAVQPLDFLTSIMSHEWVEAVTDPQPAKGLIGVDAANTVWSVVSSAEAGDLCNVESDGRDGQTIKPVDLGFVVQRTWSNASAAAGHAPCVTHNPNEVYFAAVPVLPDDVNYKTETGTKIIATRGVHVPVGTSRTIDLQLYSDAPLPPWSVVVSGSGALALSLDVPEGGNGDTLHLTLTTLEGSTSKYGVVKVQAKSGSVTHNQYVLVTYEP